VARPMPPLRRPPSGRPVAFVPAVLGGSVALVGVSVALSATEPSPFTSRGVPGALGVMVSVIVALLAGPLAGVVVALVGGLAFAILVADTELGGFVAAGVWALSALLSGMIADRFRAAGRERDVAHAAERHRRHHVDNQERAHAVIAEALPHLGEEQRRQAARVAEESSIVRRVAHR